MKSLLFATILSALIPGAFGATIFTTESLGTTASGGYRGLIVTLDKSIYTQQSSDSGVLLADQEQVQLDSLTLTNQSNSGYYTGLVYLLVFEAKDSFASSVTGPLLGASSVVNWQANNGDFTFNFASGVLLSPDTKYSFVFSSSADSYQDLAGANDNARSLRLVLRDQGAGNAGDQGVYSASKGLNTGRHVAKMAISTSSVPEPSTAALGMVGLVGLFLRRRRK